MSDNDFIMDIVCLRRSVAGISPDALGGLLREQLQDPSLPESDARALSSVWEAWVERLHVVCGAARGAERETPVIVPAVEGGVAEGAAQDVSAIFLAEEVEAAVDAAWRDSPLQGLLLDATAKALILRATAQLLPQTAADGCAPVPVLSAEQARALSAAGLVHPQTGLPARRYAVLTYFPYRGGCSVCALQRMCGRGRGASPKND